MKKLSHDGQGQLNDRDTIAIAAMQGILANAQNNPNNVYFDADFVARQAYRVADALLRARN